LKSDVEGNSRRAVIQQANHAVARTQRIQKQRWRGSRVDESLDSIKLNPGLPAASVQRTTVKAKFCACWLPQPPRKAVPPKHETHAWFPMWT